MKKQYFQKDKKATVYKKAEGWYDQYGIWREGGYIPISASPLWCYTRQQSQTISFNDGNFYANDESRLFVFNYNKAIVQGNLINYKGLWYTVERVDNTDDYNTEMFVYVSDTAKGQVPSSTDLLPYRG